MISAADFDDVFGWGSAQANAVRSRETIVPLAPASRSGAADVCLCVNENRVRETQRCEAPRPAHDRSRDYAGITA